MTSKTSVIATTAPVAPRRKPREYSGLTNVKLALLHLHTMALEGAGCDPYNSRQGSDRSDAWSSAKPR
jgi:hypothetical protein